MEKKKRARRPHGEWKHLGGGDYRIRALTNERDAKGRRKAVSETLYHTTAAQARKRLRDLQAEIRTGRFHRVAPKTFAEVCDEWLAQMKREGKRPASLYTYADVCKSYLLPRLGRLRLKEITPVVVRDLYNALQDRNLSKATISLARAVLNMILNAADRWNYLKPNPATGIKTPKGAKGRVASAMTPDEARTLVETALLDLEDLAFVFALMTGLRPEEWRGLRRCYLDTEGERGLVRVREVAVKLRRGGWTFHEPKTERSVREVPFPAWLCHELKRLELFIDARRRATGEGWTNYDLVFPSHTGAPMTERTAREKFKRLLKRAGLPTHFSLYSLRYSFATLQFLAGERDRVISDLMGHKRVDFSKEVYVRVLPQMREAASDSLERLLFGSTRATLTQSATERVM